MDRVTKEVRSRNMAAVRSRGNKTTELRFVEFLRVHKITGWRRHLPLFGHPDFVFLKYRVAVFIDGCFWHGCKRCKTVPKQNQKFWKEKIERNMLRDKEVGRELRKEGWHVVRVWEHELKKDFSRIEKRLRRKMV